MHSTKTLERRAFLASTAATVVTAAAGCEDDAKNGGTTDAGTSPEAGDKSSTGTQSQTSAANGDAALEDGGNSNIDGSVQTENISSTSQHSSNTTSSDAGPLGTSSSADASSNATSQTSTSSSGSATDATSASSTTETNDSSSGSDTTSSAATTSEEMSSGNDATSSDVVEPTQDQCVEGGGTDAGTDQDGGPGVLCSTDTFNGDHCHPLVIPESDISSLSSDRTYILEDGGTGHSHVVYVSVYSIGDLLPGTAVFETEPDETGHVHECIVTCTATTWSPD